MSYNEDNFYKCRECGSTEDLIYDDPYPICCDCYFETMSDEERLPEEYKGDIYGY